MLNTSLMASFCVESFLFSSFQHNSTLFIIKDKRFSSNTFLLTVASVTV